MSHELRVALIAGPMYDELYERIPIFENETGLKVNIAFKGDHPALNERLAQDGASFDLVSTHSKYAPSQQHFLRPLDGLLDADALSGFAPATIELMRFRGALMQLPRVIDSKIFFLRQDVFADPAIRQGYEQKFGRALRMPESWDELVEVACFLKRDGLNGFVFPGKESGLFGHFYEILESAGGTLFHDDLSPAFVSAEGRYALETLVKLFRDAACKELTQWHYDEVANTFLAGQAALSTDWPGGYHRYLKSAAIADKFDVAIYPQGPSGLRKVYSGAHSFALTTGTKDVPAALELLCFLTSPESQLHEARLGSVVPRTAAMQTVTAEAQRGSREARRLEILSRTMTESMCIPPKFPEYPQIEDALWSSIQAALTGKLNVTAALEAAAAAARAVLPQKTKVPVKRTNIAAAMQSEKRVRKTTQQASKASNKSAKKSVRSTAANKPAAKSKLKSKVDQKTKSKKPKSRTLSIASKTTKHAKAPNKSKGSIGKSSSKRVKGAKGKTAAKPSVKAASRKSGSIKKKAKKK